MKRVAKSNKRVRKAEAVSNEKLSKNKEVFENGFFSKLIETKALLVLIILIFVIGIFAFKDYFLLKKLFFFKDIGSDSITQRYPQIVHNMNLLSEGFVSKWSFYVGMGQNYFTGFVTEPYGLLRKLIDKIGILFSEDYFVYAVFYKSFIFNILLIGVIFFFYLRTIKTDKYTSIIGALLMAFSGYLILGSSWSFGGEVLRGVFLLFAFEQLMIKKRWYFFPWAVIFLSGNLFLVYIYSLFLVIYAIFRFYDVFGYKPKEFGLLLSKMIGFGILGLAINSVNIVRGFYKMFFSPRVSGSASYTDVLTSGVNTGIDYSSNFATSLLRFFSNDILGNGSNFNGWNNYLEAPAFYAGIISLMLIPQVFSFLNLKKKVIFASFLMFWLLIAFIPQLRYAFYLYMGDYYRVGLDFIIPFILILFSVFALKEIIKNQKINIVVLVLTAVSLIIILYFPYKSLPENAIDKNIRLLVSFLIITYSGLLILLSKKSFKKIAKISIVLLVIFELSVFSYNTAGKRKTYSKYEYDKTKFGYNDNTIASVKYLKSIDKSFYRIEKDYYSGIAQHGSLNGAKAQSYYGTASYSSFNQLNYIRFLEESGIIEKGNETQTRWSVGLRGRPLMYTFGNVKYHLSDKAEPEFLNFGFDSINSFGKVKVLKNRYFVPFGYTYEKFITADDFKKLKEFRKQVILLNAFVFEKEMFYDSLGVDFKELTIKDTNLIASSSKFNFELYKNYTDKLKEDTLQIKHFEQSKIIGEIDLKKTKLLFLTIPFDEGWKITDNGKKRKLSRVNFGFTGIILSKGKHELKLEYVPGYYYVSSIVSIFFMIFTLALIIFDMIRKKRLHKAEKL